MIKHSVAKYKQSILDSEVVELCKNLLTYFDRFYELTGDKMDGDEIILISRDWKDVERKEMLLLITTEEASVKKQKLTVALISIVNGLSDYYYDVLNGKVIPQKKKETESLEKQKENDYWLLFKKKIAEINFFNKEYLKTLFQSYKKLIKMIGAIAVTAIIIVTLQNRKNTETTQEVVEKKEEEIQKEDFSEEQQEIYLELIEYGNKLYKQKKLFSAKLEYQKALDLAKPYNVNTTDLENNLRICRKAIREYQRHLKENPTRPTPIEKFEPMKIPQESPKVIQY